MSAERDGPVVRYRLLDGPVAGLLARQKLRKVPCRAGDCGWATPYYLSI